jgi:hypothetical protein
MCVIPWDSDADVSDVSGLGSIPVNNWRLLSGHDTGNILLFDPRLPHFKPVLTIQFQMFSNIAPKCISVLLSIGLLCVTRSDGTVQLLAMLTSRSHWMKSAIDPTKPVRFLPACECSVR